MLQQDLVIELRDAGRENIASDNRGRIMLRIATALVLLLMPLAAQA
jgi:hypothetical protein